MSQLNEISDWLQENLPPLVAEHGVPGAARYPGKYERASATLDVLQGENGLVLDMTPTGPLAGLFPTPPRVDLVPVDDSTFLLRENEDKTWSSLAFHALPTGEEYVHMGVRATPEVSR
ncbi:hypothetical protein [Lentzea sp. CC55]|uniref:hypothetical protein n=1 Tax=Lentzea sp. CC55 TaxID=2884909 RepID=UPI001F35F695|nr:hypothetical protein [Lentzea sp. CC55]MCG8922527.1 hypothetical protein [Lentzea sp. CC55]